MPKSTKSWANLNFNLPLSKNFVHSFLFERKGAGIDLLFGLIEYLGILSDTKMLEMISDRLRSYYFDDKIWDEEVEGELQELQLENSLKKLNNRINSLLGSSPQSWDPNALKIVIGTLHQEQASEKFKLCLTQTGNKTKALVFHRSKEGDFKSIDVFANQDLNDRFNPLKIFSHLISGQLTSADQILISSDSLFDLLSSEEIKKTIINLPPASALEHLKNHIIQSNFSFGGVIIKVEALSPSKLKNIKTTAGGSVKRLFETEKKTKELLAPGLTLNLLRNLKVFLNTAGNKLNESFKMSERAAPAVQKFSQKLVGLTQNLKRAIPPGTVEKAAEIFKKVSELLIKYIKKFSKIAFLLVINWSRSIFSWFRSLSTKHKVSLGGGLILIFVFAGSLLLLSNSQAKAKEEKNYRRMVFEVEDKIDRAEAAIIFKEDDKAKANLLEAKKLLAGLPQNSRQRKEKAEKLQDTINSKFQQLSRLVKISKPKLLAEIREADLKHLGLVGDKLILAGNQPTVWLVSLKSEPEVRKFEKVPKSSKTWQQIVSEENNLYLFDQDKKLLVYDKKTNSFSPQATPLRDNYQVKDVSLYNSRLYVLEALAPQIYRFGRASGGFAAEAVKWLKDSASLLNGVVSFTVDNQIYLLKSNGQVIKLDKGFLANPPMQTIKAEPMIQSASKIYTQPETPYLYVLDPPTKRLLVFTKTGQLVIQYSSEKFDQLSDVAVDTLSKKVYLLNGSKVFEVDLKI